MFVGAHPDFPRPGVLFRDLSPLIADARAFQVVTREIADRCRDAGANSILGIESRGFIFGAAVAHSMGLGFVPCRKAGKLPGETRREPYSLEYGDAVLELSARAFDGISDPRVAIVDDVLATGGTGAAAERLVRTVGAVPVTFQAVIELVSLHGRARLSVPFEACLQY